MHCAICKKQKDVNVLSAKRSSLWHNYRYIVCDECKAKNHEPRWLVVLVARTEGHEVVRNHIQKRLYPGDVIVAEEIVP